MSKSPQALLHVIVHGRVQNVGYRAFAQRRARELGITGYARNRSNGVSVEVVAEGTQAALDALLASLRTGPSSGHVDKVDVSWGEATCAYQRFEAR